MVETGSIGLARLLSHRPPALTSLGDLVLTSTMLSVMLGVAVQPPLYLLRQKLEILATDGAAGLPTHKAASTRGSALEDSTPPKQAQGVSKGEAALRALAALPKGMRFNSPKSADKSRAANKRRLAASARAVANDRWAAQLGYQDSQEHIRDLK